MKRRDYARKTTFSIVAILLMILSSGIVINLPEIKGTDTEGDIFAEEAENLYYDASQIVDDDQPTDVLIPDVSKTSYNFFYRQIVAGELSSGTYKYYFRARSDYNSRIRIGINDNLFPDYSYIR